MTDVRGLATVVNLLKASAQLAARQAPTGSAGWRYRSFTELLLDQATVFVPCADDLVLPDRRGPSGRCFENAATWSDHEDLVYAEGFASTVHMPLGTEHAWCLTESGAVLDPTWDPLGTVYVGLAVTAAYRRSVAFPSLLHPHAAGIRLLQEGLPAEAHATYTGGSQPRRLRQLCPPSARA